ncbi:DNA directed RNA polymerase [Entophlyctis helioformis]|nr:DNA directed RNA polymerase [Entophlyctis helioformis]
MDPARQQRTDVTYTCAECGADNQIKPREPIRCKDCGYRIMYKKRTKRSASLPLSLLCCHASAAMHALPLALSLACSAFSALPEPIRLMLTSTRRAQTTVVQFEAR